MKVTNNGKGLIIEVDYKEAAILTEAIRKSVPVYEQKNNSELAKQIKHVLNELLNNQIIEGR